MQDDQFLEDELLRPLYEVSPPAELRERVFSASGERPTAGFLRRFTNPARRRMHRPLLAATAMSVLVGAVGAAVGLRTLGAGSPGGGAAPVLKPLPTGTPADTSTPPPDGLTRSQAEDIALRTARPQSGTAPRVIAAASGPLHDFWGTARPPGIDGEHWVWAVVLSGRYAGPCGPLPVTGVPAHCAPASTEMIVLDYQNGAFTFASYPASHNVGSYKANEAPQATPSNTP